MSKFGGDGVWDLGNEERFKMICNFINNRIENLFPSFCLILREN